MDLAAFTRDASVSSLSVPLLLFLLSLFISKQILSNFPYLKRKKPLPPGPKQWPIIGNLHQMGSEQLHILFARFAKQHGPLFSLRLGSQLVVIGSSPEAATEILKTHDRLFSARHILRASPFEHHVLGQLSLMWAPTCTDSWKALRALCRTELFSARAIDSQANLREKKVAEMVRYLAEKEGKVVNIGEVVFNNVFSSLCVLFFSEDYNLLEDCESKSKALIRKVLDLARIPNICDFYPILSGLDPQDLKKKAKMANAEFRDVWGSIIRERREKRARSAENQDKQQLDFLDVFLANDFSDEKINRVFNELFIAGTDTTLATVEFTMAELLKNEEAMEKVREELSREIKEYPIKESHVSQLTYLNACMKETLRLHPPVPFLLPHRALETCEVLSYTIPKNSKVFVNVWAIGRDPTYWDDPTKFCPERFIGSELDYKGRHFEYLPFGSGRRICPGLPMAAKRAPLLLASLVHCFDWSLPNKEDFSKLDMEEDFGLTLQKKQPLLLLPKRKVLSH